MLGSRTRLHWAKLDGGPGAFVDAWKSFHTLNINDRSKFLSSQFLVITCFLYVIKVQLMLSHHNPPIGGAQQYTLCISNCFQGACLGKRPWTISFANKAMHWSNGSIIPGPPHCFGVMSVHHATFALTWLLSSAAHIKFRTSLRICSMHVFFFYRPIFFSMQVRIYVSMWYWSKFKFSRCSARNPLIF